MIPLGDRTVTVAYLGGPADGHTRPYQRAAGCMPDLVDGYQLVGPHPFDATVWRYAWAYTHTGRRQPCSAGCEQYPGSRCPSAGRRRQTA
ncbi:hypothetical protein [Pseudonocardia broussonetiae]|uniref:Uncharacterized protein n=1 Tax=Pseudonocardia broussonetiae TaxID=2736640 RepID=A0A6M6JI02_9PSEU|nr:hypothetical protein [Pseudonocardia broussonetiae]QJY46680.1 hypothetical protein HOP40_13325 [Pseudonocardia broussonetiae]